MLSTIRRTLHRMLSRYVITILWEGDTYKHYTFKRNEIKEWVDAYPTDITFNVSERY